MIASVLVGLVAQMAYAPQLIAQELNRMQVRRAVADAAVMARVGVDEHAGIEVQIRQIRAHLLRLTSSGVRSEHLGRDLDYLLERTAGVKESLFARQRTTARSAAAAGLAMLEQVDPALRDDREQITRLERHLRSLRASVRQNSLQEQPRQRTRQMLVPTVQSLSTHGDTGAGRSLARQIQRSPQQRTGSKGPFAYPWALASLDNDVLGDLFVSIGDDWLAEGQPVDADQQPAPPYVDFSSATFTDSMCDPESPDYDPIRCLANELDHDPLSILGYVRNEIRYDPYFGANKSASRTLRDGAGNDLDIASALIALLRCSGVPARYVFGTIEISETDATEWLGTQSLNDTSRWLSDAGIANEVDDGEGVIRLDHVWVSAYLDTEPYRSAAGAVGTGDAWVDLDGSYKRHQLFGRSTTDDIGADPDGIRRTALMPSTRGEVQTGVGRVAAIDSGLIANEMQARSGLLGTYLLDNDISVTDAFRERRVVRDQIGYVPLSDYYAIHSRGLATRDVPNSLRSSVTIEVLADHGTISYTGWVAELAESDITLVAPLTDESLAIAGGHGGPMSEMNAGLLRATPRLFINTFEVPPLDFPANPSPTSVGDPLQVYLDVDLPGVVTTPNQIEVFAGGVASVIVNPHVVSTTDLADAARSIASVQPELEALRTAPTSVVMDESERALTIARAIGTPLRAMGLGYFYQSDRANRVTANALDLGAVRTPSAAVASWNVVPEYFDSSPGSAHSRVAAGPLSLRTIRDAHVVAPLANVAGSEPRVHAEQQFLRLTSMTASVLEASSLQHAVAADDSLSLVDVLRRANDASASSGDLADGAVFTLEPPAAGTLPSNFGSDTVLGTLVADALDAGQTVTAADPSFTFGTAAADLYTAALLRDGTREGTEQVVVDAMSGTVVSALVRREWMHVRDVLDPSSVGSDETPALEQILDFDQFSTSYENLLQATLEWITLLQPAYEQNSVSYAVASMHGDLWTDTEADYPYETDTLLALLYSGIGTQDTASSVILSATVTSLDDTRPTWVAARNTASDDIILNAEVLRAGAWQLDARRLGELEFETLADGLINQSFGSAAISASVQLDDSGSTGDLDGLYDLRLLITPPGDGDPFPIQPGDADTVEWNGSINVDRVAPEAHLSVVPPAMPGDSVMAGDPERGTLRVEGWVDDFETDQQNYASLNFEQYTISIQGAAPGDEEVIVASSLQPVPPLGGGDPSSTLVIVDTREYDQGETVTLRMRANDAAGNTGLWTTTAVVQNPLTDTTLPTVTVLALAIPGSAASLAVSPSCAGNDVTDANVGAGTPTGQGDGQLMVVLNADDDADSVLSLAGSITTLELVVDDTVLATRDVVPPTQSLTNYEWHTGVSAYALPNGESALTIRATDTSGNQGVSQSICLNTQLTITDFVVTPRIANANNSNVDLIAEIRAAAVDLEYEFRFEWFDDSIGDGVWSAVQYDRDTPQLTGLISANSGAQIVRADSVHAWSLEVNDDRVPDGSNYRVVLSVAEVAGPVVAQAALPFGVNLSNDRIEITISKPEHPRLSSPDGSVPGRPLAVVTTPTMLVEGRIRPERDNLSEVSYGLVLEPAENNTGAPSLYGVPPDGDQPLWTWTRFTSGWGFRTIEPYALSDHDSHIATVDMTSVPNGTYDLYVVAGEVYGDISSGADVRIEVASTAKIGELAFAQEDRGPQIGTVPVTLTRTYSSNATHTDGPFGPGWSMALFDLDVQVAGFQSPGDAVNGITPRRDGNTLNRSVTLTLPNGQRTVFGYELNQTGYGFADPRYDSLYRSPPGVDASLRGVPDLELRYLNIFTDPIGVWYDVSGSSSYVAHDVSFEMPGFILELADGTKYTLARDHEWIAEPDWIDTENSIRIYSQPYVSRVELPNGDALVPQYDGTDRETILGVDFEFANLDAAGQPIDPMRSLDLVWSDDGSRVRALFVNGLPYYLYQYSDKADPNDPDYVHDRDHDQRLTKVCRLTDAPAIPLTTAASDADVDAAIAAAEANGTGDVTRFIYDDATYPDGNTNDTYALMEVIDPRGINVLGTTYDDAGRLSTSLDAFGESVTISRDVEAREERVTDRSGATTVYNYDANGNVVREELPHNVVVERAYNVAHSGLASLVTKETRVSDDGAVSLSSHYRYDEKFNQTMVVQPDGSATETAYEYFSGTSIPSEVVTTSGSVVIDGEDWDDIVPTSQSTQRFDSRGNLLYSSSSNGSPGATEKQVTQYEYDPQSRILTVVIGGDSTLTRNGGSNPELNATVYYYDSQRPELGSQPVKIERYGDALDTPESVQELAYDEEQRQYRSLSAVYDDVAGNYDVVGQYTKHDYVGRSMATASIRLDANAANAGSALAHSNLPSDYAAIAIMVANGSVPEGLEARLETASFYDGNDQLIASVDRENNRTTTTLRDARGDVIETAEWSFDLVDVVEASADQGVTESNFLGWFRNARYGGTGPMLPAGVDADVIVVRTVYDEASRPVFVTDRQDFTDSTYLMGPPNQATGGAQTWYDGAGRAYNTERFSNLTIGFADVDGLLSTTATPGGTRNSQSFTDYDSLGRVAYTEDAVGNRTSYTYDDNSRQRTVTVEYAGSGNGTSLTTTYEYDALGRVSQATNPEGVGLKYQYDAQGRRVKTEFEATADHGASDIVTSYDNDGRKVSETNQVGQTRRYVYDESDRLRAVLLPNPDTGVVYSGDVILDDSPTLPNASLLAARQEGPVYAYWYDDQGNLTHLLSPMHDSDDMGSVDELFSQTSLEYDASGRRTKRTLPGSRSEQWRFGADPDSEDGADDRLWLRQDFVGNITRNVYDEHGRTTARHYYLFNVDSGPKPDLHDAQFSETATNDPVGQHPHYTVDIIHEMEYDKLDRISQVHIKDGDTLRETIIYSYYQDGRLMMINADARGTIGYTYHNDGRIKTITTDVGTPDAITTEYEYDFAGRLKTVDTDGVGDWTYEYTRLGQRSSLDFAAETGTDTLTEYTYDRLGRLDTLTNSIGPNNMLISEFDYTVRADGRRTAVTETTFASGGVTDIEYIYDHLNRLTREGYGSNSIEYDYDIAGNRREKVINSDGTTNTIVYNYTDVDPDWLTSETHSGPVAKTITYTRDANGFLTKKVDSAENTEQYTPDAMGRLAAYSNNDSANPVAATYLYDHRGILTNQSVAGTAGTRSAAHLIDSLNPTGYAQRLKSFASGAGMPVETTRRTFGDDLLAETEGSSTCSLLYDGQGTTRDAVGGTPMLEHYTLDAYGEPRPWVPGGMPDSPKTNHIYTGEAQDSEATGWTYLRARYLDTSTGTFNRLDPFFGNTDDPQSLHKYAYVHADPVNAWDPSGLSFVSNIAAIAIISGILSGIVGGVAGGFKGAVYGFFIGAAAGIGLAILVSVLSFATLAAMLIVVPSLAAQLTVATVMFVWTSLITAYFIWKAGEAAKNARNERELLAAELSLFFLVAGMVVGGVVTARLAAKQYATRVDVRASYKRSLAEIQNEVVQMQNSGASLQTQARYVHHRRNALKMRAQEELGLIDRSAARARNRVKYGNPEGPTFEQMLTKARDDYGLVGDDAYRFVIGSGQRSNTGINRALEQVPRDVQGD
ncbi:MAG: transglutaminase domain-containing protein [Planctomycetota bacterium]